MRWHETCRKMLEFIYNWLHVSNELHFAQVDLATESDKGASWTEDRARSHTGVLEPPSRSSVAPTYHSIAYQLICCNCISVIGAGSSVEC